MCLFSRTESIHPPIREWADVGEEDLTTRDFYFRTLRLVDRIEDQKLAFCCVEFFFTFFTAEMSKEPVIKHHCTEVLINPLDKTGFLRAQRKPIFFGIFQIHWTRYEANNYSFKKLYAEDSVDEVTTIFAT